MKFKKLCDYFDRIEQTQSRLEMIDIIVDLYSDCVGDEIDIVSYLINGRVAPEFIPVEFNLANKSVIKIMDRLGEKDAQSLFQEMGDVGLVAENIIGKSSGGKYDLKEVYEDLWGISMVSGTGSVERRARRVSQMAEDMSGLEVRFLFRILVQKLRLGSSSKTVLDALSVLKVGDKSAREKVEAGFARCSDLGYVARICVEEGIDALSDIKIVPGIPVASMLVEREKDAESIMKRIPRALVQPKYDGLRCQIHVGVTKRTDFESRVWWDRVSGDGGDQESLLGGEFGEKSSGGRDGVRLFSRNLEDMTDMFPDVVKEVEKLNVDSAIFDSEIVGYDESADEYVPFQQTMTRKRKYDIQTAVDEVPVKVFVFDLLYLDDESWLDRENKERVDKCKDILDVEGFVRESGSQVVGSANELELYFQERIAEGLEGAIVKDPGSKYQPGARGYDWIKMKAAFQGGLADTVDLVVLGYYMGRGRQSKFGIGAVLGGVYDREKDRFLTLAKIGTGVTDDQWEKIKSDLDPLEVQDQPKNVEVNKSLNPDVWVKPEIVMEVEADEITQSPIHTANYALRFPRLKVWNRDKKAERSTHLGEVVKMYKKL